MVNKLLAVPMILLLCFPLRGQGTYTFNAAVGTYPSSGPGIDVYPPSRFYMPLYDNLLAAVGSFMPTQRDQAYVAASGTTTSFTGPDSYDQLPSGLTLTYTVRCHYVYGSWGCTGGAYGCTGTVTSYTVAVPGTSGPVFTLGTACGSAIVGGDVVEIKGPIGGINALTQNGWGMNGSGTFAWDTTAGDQAPAVGSLPTPPGCLQIASSNAGPTNVYTLLDGASQNYILMNGTTTMSLMASVQSGAVTVTMTAQRIGGSTFVNATDTLSGGTWATYTASGSGSETASAPVGTILVQYAFNGSGVVCVTAPSLTGAATNGGAWTHTNGSPLLDQMVLEAQQGNYDAIRYNYTGGVNNVDLCQNIVTLIQPAKYRLQCNASDQSYAAQGVPLGIDDQFKFAQSAGLHRVKIAVSPLTTAADYANLAEYMGGACGSSTFAQYRCDLGQSTPWNQVFTNIEIGWNETWNNASPGQYLGPSRFETAIGMGIIAATALKADSTWNSSVEKFSVPMQPGAANIAILTSADPTHKIDLADFAYYYNMNTTNCAEPVMFQNLIAEAFGDMVDSALNYYNIGNAGFPVSNYETAFGAITGNCTVAGVTGLPDGLGGGMVDALIQSSLQLAWPGIFMNENEWVLTSPNTTYTSTAGSSPATTIPMWSKFPNSRGIGNTPSANVYASQLYNACAKYGTGFTPSTASVPTITTTAANGIPAEPNVPLVPVRAFKGTGTSRCYVFFNLDSTSHTVTLAGPDVLTGTVTKTVYASSNGTPGLQDNNEAITSAAVVYNTASSAAASTTYTLGPYSMMSLAGNAATVTSGGWTIPVH